MKKLNQVILTIAVFSVIMACAPQVPETQSKTCGCRGKLNKSE